MAKRKSDYEAGAEVLVIILFFGFVIIFFLIKWTIQLIVFIVKSISESSKSKNDLSLSKDNTSASLSDDGKHVYRKNNVTRELSHTENIPKPVIKSVQKVESNERKDNFEKEDYYYDDE